MHITRTPILLTLLVLSTFSAFSSASSPPGRVTDTLIHTTTSGKQISAQVEVSVTGKENAVTKERGMKEKKWFQCDYNGVPCEGVERRVRKGMVLVGMVIGVGAWVLL